MVRQANWRRTAGPTRPLCEVLRPSSPAAAQAAANRRLIWWTARPMTASVGVGDVAAYSVSDGAGGALCGFGGVDGVSTVSRGPRRSRGAPLGGAVAASGVGTSMVRARP